MNVVLQHGSSVLYRYLFAPILLNVFKLKTFLFSFSSSVRFQFFFNIPDNNKWWRWVLWRVMNKTETVFRMKFFYFPFVLLLSLQFCADARVHVFSGKLHEFSSVLLIQNAEYSCSNIFLFYLLMFPWQNCASLILCASFFVVFHFI